MMKIVFCLLSNYGTENDDSKYHNGNDEPKGFGKFASHYLYFVVPFQAIVLLYSNISMLFLFGRIRKNLSNKGFTS